MRRAVLIVLGTAAVTLSVISVTLYAGAPHQRAGRSPTTATTLQRTVLDRYCVTCNNDRLKTTGLLLDEVLAASRSCVQSPVSVRNELTLIRPPLEPLMRKPITSTPRPIWIWEPGWIPNRLNVRSPVDIASVGRA